MNVARRRQHAPQRQLALSDVLAAASASYYANVPDMAGSFGRQIGSYARRQLSRGFGSRSPRKVNRAPRSARAPRFDAKDIKQTVYDKAYTPSGKVNGKKKRRKTSRRPAFSSREKKSIRRIIDVADAFSLVKNIKQTKFSDFTCRYNKVAWLAPNLSEDVSFYINDISWKVRSPGTTNIVTNSVTEARQGQKIRVADSFNYHFHNNTNMPGDMEIVVWTCMEYTSTDPFVELVGMRDAQYCSTTTSVAIVDDFTQFFSVPGQRRTLWKKHQHFKIKFRGGENSQQFIKCKPFTIDVNRWLEEGQNTYCPGQHYIEVRMRGQTTHSSFVTGVADTTEPERYQNQMSGFFTLDVQTDHVRKYFMNDASDVMCIYQVLASTGLVTPESSDDRPVAGDPTIPDVGKPDQA